MIENNQLLEALSKSDMFQTYQEAFSEMTGMPIALRPVETWQLPLRGQRRENPFCALMAQKSRTCAACLVMQEELGKAACEGPATVTCAYGLCETAVPVKLGARTIGLLQTGQVMRQKPTSAGYDRAVGKAREMGTEIDSPDARDAYLGSPAMSQKKLDAATSLLTTFADHLSMKSNQIAIQEANAEPPMITKAKNFIRENFTEDLSLGQVAAHVHTSVFYFCKMFHKATGTTFTEYLSRIRIERAKDLLLNPNLRVSEIAYEVGFQSLTHFNRVFRSITGESPTTFRSHLTKAPSRADRPVSRAKAPAAA